MSGVGGEPSAAPHAAPPSSPSSPAFQLDALPPQILLAVKALLPRKGACLLTVNRGTHQAVADQHRWDMLRSRAKRACTAAQVGALLKDAGMAEAGTAQRALSGERKREARLLGTLVSQLESARWVIERRLVMDRLQPAIMALPAPARYTPLRLWLGFHAAFQRDKMVPGAGWRQDLYCQLPAAEKAQFCIDLLRRHRSQVRYDPVALGIDGTRWTALAAELPLGMLRPFTLVVLESRRPGTDPLTASWPALANAVLDVLAGAMVLPPARRAGVLCGILEYGSRILGEISGATGAPVAEANLARPDSIWRKVLDAVPPEHAFGPLHTLANPSDFMERVGAQWHAVSKTFIAEVERLMHRVDAQAPQALTNTQRAKILLLLDRDLCGSQLTAHWLVLANACQDPNICSADARRMATALLAGLHRLDDNESTWRVLLALCQSPRLSPVAQATALAVIESSLPPSSGYFRLTERLPLALDLAANHGPLEALQAMMPAFSPEQLDRALQILFARPEADIRAVLRHVASRVHAESPQAMAIFDRLPLHRQLTWIGEEYTAAPSLQRLMETQRGNTLQPAMAAALFHGVASHCIRHSWILSESAPLLALVAPLREMLEQYWALRTDAGAWASMFSIISEWRRQEAVTAAQAQHEIDVTWDLLLKLAPDLKDEVQVANEDRCTEPGG